MRLTKQEVRPLSDCRGLSCLLTSQQHRLGCSILTGTAGTANRTAPVSVSPTERRWTVCNISANILQKSALRDVVYRVHLQDDILKPQWRQCELVGWKQEPWCVTDRTWGFCSWLQCSITAETPDFTYGRHCDTAHSWLLRNVLTYQQTIIFIITSNPTQSTCRRQLILYRQYNLLPAHLSIHVDINWMAGW